MAFPILNAVSILRDTPGNSIRRSSMALGHGFAARSIFLPWGSAMLLGLGIPKPVEALFRAVKWDVLGSYWGFMMVSHLFHKSRMPDLISNRILSRARVEKHAIFALCAITAFLSAFMDNVPYSISDYYIPLVSS
jgi:Na+/H+ antiporter NhaD/arsenite permease-like protein